jgi:hypothetical protein
MEQFIDDILNARGLPADLDAEVRAQLAEDLAVRVTQVVNTRLIEAMPEEALEGFNKLADDPATTNEQLQQYVADHVSDVEGVTRQALVDFRGLYLSDDNQTEA